MATVYLALFFKVAFLYLAMSTYICDGNLFGSLQFTRNALLRFSRVVTKPATTKSPIEFDLGRSFGGKPKGPKRQPQSVNVHRPSNKFLEVINEIEKAVVANAGAMDNRVRNNERTKTTLSRLLANAIKSKSYKYARDVLGKVLNLLRTESSRRRKRSPENEGATFLQELRQTLGNDTFDSFMAVKGDVSLIFVVDDTGSMSDEIQAVKKIATAVVNYTRKGPVEYMLSPFNDPMSGGKQIVLRLQNKCFSITNLSLDWAVCCLISDHACDDPLENSVFIKWRVERHLVWNGKTKQPKLKRSILPPYQLVWSDLIRVCR